MRIKPSYCLYNIITLYTNLFQKIAIKKIEKNGECFQSIYQQELETFTYILLNFLFSQHISCILSPMTCAINLRHRLRVARPAQVICAIASRQLIALQMQATPPDAPCIMSPLVFFPVVILLQGCLKARYVRGGMWNVWLS